MVLNCFRDASSTAMTLMISEMSAAQLWPSMITEMPGVIATAE